MADFEDQWPIAKYHFRVTIDGEEMSFQEVSGMEVETQVIEYRHGDSEFFHPIKMAGLLKVGDITLKRGCFEEGDELLELFNAIYEDKAYYTDEESRMELLIELLDEEGETMMTWNVERAIPIKLKGTDLNSTANEVAVEELVMSCEYVDTQLDG